ncbi:MAG: site-specific DNA-methyltransferase [Clostridia bacterium]|nr:site-specific DNA-methyltransferase [Clostridia bacterium]
MNCKKIIELFLIEFGIEYSSYSNALNKLEIRIIDDSADIEYNYGKSLLQDILVDVYHLNAENVKSIANILSKTKPIGRFEKNIIKHFLDYNDKTSFETLVDSLKDHGITEENLVLLLVRDESLITKATSLFIENWNSAERANCESKKQDFLQGIYTRLVSFLNSDVLSLKDILNYNMEYILKELREKYITELELFCSSETKLPSYEARRIFCDKYNEILKKSLQEDSNNNLLESIMNKQNSTGTPFSNFETEDYSLVVFNINQKLYDVCKDFDTFMNVTLSIIKDSYRLLENHKTFAINIENVYDSNHANLKWKLYSYIGIFAEHFIPTVEKRKFYKPEELCVDKANYIGIEISEENKKNIKLYFEGKLEKTELASLLYCSIDEINEILLDFENVWYGYTFADCLSISTLEMPQCEEISFIKNENSLLFIFNKYRHDDRKIPCPDCAGLNISGNSFPEVGHRSWECKNDICPSRSKSNRGKRYSKKSNFMQQGFLDNDAFDLISKEMIKQWRRDICSVESNTEVIEMLVKYFSFHNEKVLFINYEECVCDIFSTHERNGVVIPLEQINYSHVDNVFRDYFEKGLFIKRFLNQKKYKKVPVSKTITNDIERSETSVLIKGDSRMILSRIKYGTVTSAVTSPPYYNARLYSQWQNLYLYLSDMYEIIKETSRVMKEGGIYLYNIGDICGNENTVVRSTMGDKRILLGSYTIFLFLNAGFELLDNILWDKGQPQSNRHKNDGKFTPFYQKPMNVYEHMFIFKKIGAPAIVNDDVASVLPKDWNKNIVSFSPVIKINSKGENTLGHTAPYPEDIPNFVAKVFTKNSSDIVLDPFAGSGTTIFAVSKAGNKALGIELSEEYCDLILNRSKEENIVVKYFDK